MEPISIEGTTKTPTVKFDAGTGKIEIKGRSIPENSIEFYKPLVDWLEEYAKGPLDKTSVNVQLEYFNTSSSKILLRIFKTLEKVQLKNKQIEINWHFEEDDLDMKECGQDFSAMLNIPFTLIEEEVD